MRYFFFFLFFLNRFLVVAQTTASETTVSGSVADAQTLAPLAGVGVAVGGQARTATEASGAFSFATDSASVAVTFSAVGYQPLTVRLSAGTPARIRLQLSSVQLNEVIVRAYEANRRALDVPAAVATLSQRDLERFAPVSLVPAMSGIL